MKAGRAFALLLFAFLLLSSSSLARPLSTAPQVLLGGGKPEADGNLAAESIDLSNLMGVEAEESCGDKDEECLKRRMIAEAHLDYIYTQDHKP